MALDRSKFKATKLAANKEKDQAVDSAMGRQGRAERADLHKINPGKNYFRIYPPHPTDNDDDSLTFSEPVVRVFLPAMVEEKDDKGVVQTNKKGEPLMKETSKPVFNSRIHGDTLKDLVEEYVALGKKIAEDEKAAGKDRDNFLAKLLGKFSRNKDERLPGLLYKTSYAMYADKIENGEMVKFARLEVGVAVKDGMNKASATEDADDAMQVDPWTDVEDGRAVVIEYNDKATKPADYYNVQMDNITTKVAGVGQVVRSFPLSDAQLENYMKFPSLAKLYKKAFKRRDFQLQLEGLELFDAKYDLGIFEREEFQTIVEEIDSYYPEVDAEDSNEEPSESKAAPVKASSLKQKEEPINDMPWDKTDEVAEEEEEPEEASADELDLMNRVELKSINTSEALGIKILTTMSDDALRAAIRNARLQKGPEEEELEEEPVVAQAPPAGKKETVKERMARLKEGKK